MYESAMKMGKTADGQRVYGTLHKRKENKSTELSNIVDSLNQSHAVQTDSIFDCLTLRDNQLQDIYDGHIISCLIDGEIVNQLVASGFEYTDEDVVTIWMPFDQCSMERGSNNELIDVRIIGHSYENPELLELVD